MKTRLLKLRRYFFKQALGLFSVTALLFVFEACYGTPQAYEDDIEISGTVKSSLTGEPIKGISILLENEGRYISTDENGEFIIYAFPSNVYIITAEDLDGTENGLFKTKRTTLSHDTTNRLELEFYLDEKETE